MPNSNQARIWVLGFSANIVWLVRRFRPFYFFLGSGDSIGAGPDFTHNHSNGPIMGVKATAIGLHQDVYNLRTANY